MTQATPAPVELPELPEPVCHGMRRKGTSAIIGVLPNAIAAKRPTRDPYLADFEEPALYTADQMHAYGEACRAEGIRADGWVRVPVELWREAVMFNEQIAAGCSGCNGYGHLTYDLRDGRKAGEDCPECANDRDLIARMKAAAPEAAP